MPSQLEQALNILTELVDPDPCQYDHNRDCQAHGQFDLRGARCPNELAQKMLENRRAESLLMAETHNGMRVDVYGNPVSIDMLKSLLIPIELVKSLRVFEENQYTTKLNYTALKELRK